jgi:hypothetical protein
VVDAMIGGRKRKKMRRGEGEKVIMKAEGGKKIR